MRYFLGLLLLGSLLCGGCGLSAADAVKLDKLETQALVLSGRLADYEGEIKAVVKAIQEKRIPQGEGLILLARIGGNYRADREALKGVQESVKALRDASIPWYYYVGPAVVALLSAAGGYIPQARKAAKVAKQASSAVRTIAVLVNGIEEAGDQKTKDAVCAGAAKAGVLPELDATVNALTSG